MSRTVFAHKLALCSSLQLLRQYLLPLPHLRFCSTVQLGISLWSRELDKPSLSFRGLQRAPDFPFIDTLLVERVERFNSFQNRWKGLQRHLPLTTIFMPSFCSSRRYWLHMGKISVVAKIVCPCHRFEHRVTRCEVSERRHIPYRVSHLRQ